MQAQYEHSPPTSSRSTMAAVRPPWTARSATFSPTGPAPMITTSKVSVISLRLHSKADRRDQEEDAAQYGVPADARDRRLRTAGHRDEAAAGQDGDPAAEDHRPLATEPVPLDREDQLHDARG